jgi:hypothetical protein
MSTTSARTRGDALSLVQEELETALQTIQTLQSRVTAADERALTFEESLATQAEGLKEISDLRIALAEYKARLDAIPTGVPSVQTGVPPVETGAVPVPRERTPKLKAPEDFNPSMKTDDVDAWLDCLTRYLANFPAMTSQDKARYGVSLLRGDANIWWRTMEASHPQCTWDQFVKSMEEKWQPLNQSQQARDAIVKIKQTASVHAYSRLFMREKIRIKDMTDLEAVDRYKRGLKQDVRLYIEQTEQLKGATKLTFAELLEFAERRDSLTYQTQKEYGGNRGHNRKSDLNAITENGDCSGSDDGDSQTGDHPEELEDEMVLNAIDRKWGKNRADRGKSSKNTTRREGSIGRRMLITAEEKKFCMEKNLCFICKAQDHSARECTNRYSPLKSDRR